MNALDFSHTQLTEGKARIMVPSEKKISKELPVFYNPVMKLNRDVSLVLIKALDKKDMIVASALAGSGIRGVRFLLELNKGQIKQLFLNDINPAACALMQNNMEMNGLGADARVEISNKEANLFLRENKAFDYIDIDPFGTPAPFLDSAVVRLQRYGILAVTATDTSSLCGTFPKVCKRRYWAKPLHNELMHEVGLRILIRKVQLVGIQYEKALLPVFSYSIDHYFRVFFVCEKSKQKCDEIVKQHKCLLYDTSTMERSYSSYSNPAKCVESAGPLFVGGFADKQLVKKMLALADVKEKKLYDLLSAIYDELDYMELPFYDIHALVKKHKLGDIPKFEKILAKVKGVRTHFSDTGIRTKSSVKEIVDVIKKLHKEK